MDYKTKVENADRIAIELDNQRSSAEIKQELSDNGFYERDIISIMISAQKILGEKYSSQIKERLLAEQPIHGDEAFKSLDEDLLKVLVEKESDKLAQQERNKISQAVKAGQSPESILQQVDTRFLSAEQATAQIASAQRIQQENSGGNKFMNIGGGIGLILLTGLLLMATGRLFYFLPLIGIVMIIKGIAGSVD